ncbi:DCC1-like thiol-disulfide oxidoreductase family protein [Haloarcula halophila]|uniref:DCC1-like thiol-disulfide oxidoreductase family protein n=1 Tax=Haloarcula TaxID=2237 RepID=UPI0023E3DC6A|nr:DCC1-like thiol-disulfide oxidoreductase family protein [Halomicroarcula sp. DFY41]
MASFASVLIYDGECPYCSVAARALEELDDVGAISWYDDPSQRFLDAQFGATPFAMVLVDTDEGRVYAGRSAAEELADRAGMPGIVGSLVRDNYETIARVVGLASGRGRDPDDYHEAYDLTDDGAAAYTDLADAAVRRDITAAG